MSPLYPAEIDRVDGVTLAYAETTTAQTGITSTDLTGLSVTVAVPAGRRIRITGHVKQFNETAAGTFVVLTVREGATVLNGKLGGITSETSVGLDVQAIVTPTAGIHTYHLAVISNGTVATQSDSTYPAYILVEDITGDAAAAVPVSVPVGVLGYAIKTSSQTGITTEVAITGLSVNITVPAGRQLRITAFCHMVSSLADQGGQIRIKQDGTEVQFADAEAPRATARFDLTPSVILSPSAGAHTYTVTALRNGATNTIDVSGFAADPSWLLVEDITPTPAPANTAPSSTLGYAEVVANQGTFTAETDLTNLAVTVTVPAGRRIRISASALLLSSVLTDEVGLRIKEGAVNLRTHSQIVNAGNSANSYSPDIVLSPTAGTHTYKLSALRLAGTGNITMYANATNPAYILVEDITAQSVAAPIAQPGTWGIYTDFTPVMSWLTGATIIGRYTEIGNHVEVDYRITVTGAVTATNLLVDLPPGRPCKYGDHFVGLCYHAGLTFQNPAVCRTGGGATSFFVQDNTLFINNSHVGAGDVLTIHLSYQKA